MALPIKETPVLKGRDAVRFIQQMQKVESNPISKRAYIRAKKIYDLVKQKNKTGF